MMLWLLATLSVVTISWGIAHRLKAGSEALFALASGARVASHPRDSNAASPKPKDDPPTLEQALSVENPEPRTQYT